MVDGAYHGNTSVLTGLSPSRYKAPGGTGPDPTTHEVEQPNRYRGRHGYGDPAAGKAYAADVRRQVDRLTAAATPPAAFLVESAMGTAGSIFYPDGYLADAFAAVRAAGGLCVADEIQVERGLQRHAAETGRHLEHALAALAERHELIGDVRGHGMYIGVELVRDRETKQPATDGALVASELMKDEGVLVYPTGADGNVLKIKPPLTFTTADADLFASVLADVLRRDW